MMIQVDLTRIHDSPDLGRVAVVALLSAMPQDEARLAVEEWQAVLDTREVWDRDGAAAEAPFDGYTTGTPSEPPLFRDGDWVVETTTGRIGMVDGPQQPLGNEGQPFVEIKFGPDGPFHYYAVVALRPATEDEIAVKTGERAPPVVQQDAQRPAQKVDEGGVGTRLEDCLSAKTAGALKRAGFQVLGDLESRSGEWLLSTVDRFGKTGLAEVEAAMAAAGLALSDKTGMPQRTALPGTPADHAQAERAGPPTPRPEPTQAGNGELNLDARYAKLVGSEQPQETLRELCRRAEGELGRDKMWAILQQHSVAKINAATPDQEAAVRTSVTEALHAQ